MQDAELILRLYDLRREEVLRTNRDKLNFGFWPQSFEDVQAVMDMEHPLNTAWRQVVSYWEMVYGIGARGITHPEYLVENNGEGLLSYIKVQPYLPQLREINARAFKNTEWAATQTDVGAEYLERLTGYFAEKLGR
jgi:hypothetical protein